MSARLADLVGARGEGGQLGAPRRDRGIGLGDERLDLLGLAERPADLARVVLHRRAVQGVLVDDDRCDAREPRVGGLVRNQCRRHGEDQVRPVRGHLLDVHAARGLLLDAEHLLRQRRADVGQIRVAGAVGAVVAHRPDDRCAHRIGDRDVVVAQRHDPLRPGRDRGRAVRVGDRRREPVVGHGLRRGGRPGGAARRQDERAHGGECRDDRGAHGSPRGG
jgi:hypothetical protein